MNNCPTRIDLVFPTTPPAPLPPAHPYYEPTDAFIDRYGLKVDEAETWVELYSQDINKKRELYYQKKTGQIIIFKYQQGSLNKSEDCVFSGFVPNEQALENIIAYTGW